MSFNRKTFRPRVVTKHTMVKSEQIKTDMTSTITENITSGLSFGVGSSIGHNIGNSIYNTITDNTKNDLCKDLFEKLKLCKDTNTDCTSIEDLYKSNCKQK